MSALFLSAFGRRQEEAASVPCRRGTGKAFLREEEKEEGAAVCHPKGDERRRLSTTCASFARATTIFPGQRRET